MNKKNSKKANQEISGIKPVRSETLSNSRKRNVGGGTWLIIGSLSLINLIGLGMLIVWFFNTSGSQKEVGEGFIERISTLEETFLEQSHLHEELVQSIDSDVKLINNEIRKLWDLSNKKNRKNIDIHSRKLEELSGNLNSITKSSNTQDAKIRAVTLELGKLKTILNNLNSDLEKLAELEQFEKRVSDQEKAMSSVDAYRKQVNKSLVTLQKRIVQIEKQLLE